MRKNSYSGKFILLEGIDGSGKTTQSKMLADRLQKVGVMSFLTREPTSDNMFGRLARFIYMSESLHDEAPSALRHFLNSGEYTKFCGACNDLQRANLNRFENIAYEIISNEYKNLPMFLQLAMIFDRYIHHVDSVIPNLENGVHLVADRDFLSTLAYSAGDDISWEPLLQVHEEVLGDAFLMPDLLFIIDIPVKVGIARTMAKQQGKKDYFDTEERLTKIRKRYLELSQSPKIVKHTSGLIINTSDASPKVVHELIWSYVRPVVGSNSL